MSSTKLHITLDAANKVIKMTADPLGVNNVELIPGGMVEGVFPIGYYAGPTDPTDYTAYWENFYPYSAMTIVCIRFRGNVRPEMRIELQDVVNQVGWSTGTQAGIDQCVADFVTFLAAI